MDGKNTRVAGTARLIARCLLAASREPRYAALCPTGISERCRRLVAASDGEWFARAAGNRWFRGAFLAAVDFLLPGIVAHYLARKRCLEDWLRDGNYWQVVVLGAGLDTLAWRYAGARPDVRFFEMDLPAVLHVKARAMVGEPPPNLLLLAADLARESPMRILERDGAFDPAAPTLFIAEGLTMYLPSERVTALLTELAASNGPRTLAFTFMEDRGDGRIGFRHSHPLVGWWLRWRGEPFRWSLPPQRWADFLAGTGWHGHELVCADLLRDRYLTPAGLRDAPLAVGEWLALAQHSSFP